VRSGNFPEWDKAAAAQVNALYADTGALIADKYDAAGQDTVTSVYFPEKETEHTDWAGAILNARCIVAGIRGLDHCALTGYLLPDSVPDPALPEGKAR
jgi:hypothetical protein